jgi:hypothetical protein
MRRARCSRTTSRRPRKHYPQVRLPFLSTATARGTGERPWTGAGLERLAGEVAGEDVVAGIAAVAVGVDPAVAEQVAQRHCCPGRWGRSASTGSFTRTPTCRAGTRSDLPEVRRCSRGAAPLGRPPSRHTPRSRVRMERVAPSDTTSRTPISPWSGPVPSRRPSSPGTASGRPQSAPADDADAAPRCAPTSSHGRRRRTRLRSGALKRPCRLEDRVSHRHADPEGDGG